MHNKKHSADFRGTSFAGHAGTVCHNYERWHNKMPEILDSHTSNT